MDVYVSCSLTGGRGDQPVVAALVGLLEARGHRVLTAHLAHPEAMAADGGLAPEAVFARDLAWLEASAVVVAEVSTPSHGVGFEVAWALSQGKPVLCLAREGARVSKMISGIRRPAFRFHTYTGAPDAQACLERFLAAL